MPPSIQVPQSRLPIATPTREKEKHSRTLVNRDVTVTVTVTVTTTTTTTPQLLAAMTRGVIQKSADKQHLQYQWPDAPVNLKESPATR